jgi:uncharacterized protein (DUF4415 family)
MTTRTAAQTRAHYHHMATTLRDLESDLRWGMEGSARIPPEWHAIAQEVPAPAKVPMTLRVDADVAKFFRSMGAGHLPRMNAVLRSFMHARLAGVVKGPEAVEYQPTAMERYLLEAASIIEALQKRNLRAADGQETGAEDLRIERRLRALEDVADEAGVAEEDRLRM